MSLSRSDERDRVLELWFELASPYSYLSAMRVEPMAAAAGVRVAWRPFLLGPIFQELHGSADSPFNRNPARGRWMWTDVERRAAARGVPFRRPSQFPRGSLLATRVALLAEDEPWIGAFVRGLFGASFADDADIASDAVVRRVLEPLTPRAQELLELAAAAETKEQLRERTRRALERGVFGAPTFFVGEEMYWGDDRLEDALAAGHAATRPIPCVTEEAARDFAGRWLPAWTGDDPERLLSFYTDDAFYLDPAVPAGIRGREALLDYFRRLLRRNPAWVWTQREAIPMAHGFVNLWHASIPAGDVVHEVDGVCLVVLRGDRIARNEVYFDRSVLLPSRP